MKQTFILATVLAALLLNAQPGLAQSAVTGTHSCETLLPTDQATGKVLTGIEDIAIDPASLTAYLSVQDRWSLEDAVDSKGETLPQGGIYALSLDRLQQPDRAPALANATAAFSRSVDFHPHGLALENGAQGPRALAVINRSYEANALSGGKTHWLPSPRIEIFSLEDGILAHQQSIEDPALCNANNLAWIDERRLLVTNDRNACSGFERQLETASGQAGGSLAMVTLDGTGRGASVTTVAEAVKFANGIAISKAPESRVYVAATRDDSILAYRLIDLTRGGPAKPVKRLPVDGGADNLTWDRDGKLLVALHPSLWDLALYRHRWFGRDAAASRLIALDVDSGEATLLVEDETGKDLSAVTVGARLSDRLLLGSVTDQGLLVCRLATVQASREETG